jgi:hypothetical protein
MSVELRGSVVAAQRNIDDAKALFARAAKEEKAPGYREPPIYIRPVGETEGAAMLRAQMGRCLGDIQAASRTYSDFPTAWKDADTGLPQIAHARAYLTAHRA